MVWFLILGFIVGTILGSLVLCIASRALTKESFWGRSYCDFCKKKLSWYDLFPILSFILNRGKCRYCHKRLPVEYILVEILCGLIIAYLFSTSGLEKINLENFTLQNLSLLPSLFILSDLAFKTVFIGVLIATFITDIKTGLIPDRITYPSIAIAFVYGIILTIAKIAWAYYSIAQSSIGQLLLPPHSDYFYRHAYIMATPELFSLLAAVIVTVFFASLIFLTKGRGMGGGDLKLGIFMGLVLGFPNAILAILAAFLLGSVVGVILLALQRKSFGQTIPFGPFLTLGGIIALFWGDQIITWYVHTFAITGSLF